MLSRYVDRRAVGWPSFAADNSAFQALVLGPVLATGDLAEVARGLVVEVDGVERVRAVTGEDETDPLAGKISWVSPVARALIGKYAGDVAEVQAPGGVREYEVVDVRYV